MSTTVDLAIVGGGIVGCVAADLAAQRWPERSIALIDRSLFARGSTQHSGGHNHPFGYSPAQKVMAAESVTYYDALRTRFPGLPLRDCDLVGIVAARRGPTVVGGYLRDGVRTEAVASTVVGSLGTARLEADQVLVVGARSAYGFPAVIAEHVVRSLRANQRLMCWEGVTVESLRGANDGVALATRCGRTLHARDVLIAVGPWIRRLPAGVDVPATSSRIKKVVAMHIEQAPLPTDPIVYFYDASAYLLPVVERGHFIFSFTSDEFDCEPEISSLAITARDRELALSLLERHLPGLVNRCTNGRVFCDSYTPDGLPVVIRSSSLPRTVVVAGCSGFGFRLAPAIARRALDDLEREREG